ncbi:TPA: hypothetical protein PXO92_002666 [Yersinia enterocolitica]|nr:hypothetical protein [Yersinia enterocolitica]
MSITPQEVGSFFMTLVVPITIGAVAAGITAYLALNRFYREKWWEKKHASYNQLIEKLFEIKGIYSLASDFYEAEHYDLPYPKGEVDWAKFHEIKAQLHRFYVLSPISLGSKSRELLNEFFKQDADIAESVHEEGYPDFLAYNDMTAATQKLIDAIVLDAEKELKFK